MTDYAYPQAIKNVKVTPDHAPSGPIYDAFDYRVRFPDGRIISNSNLASKEAGKLLFDAATIELYEEYQSFLDNN